ncbi:MAG: ComF family protein [Prevotella sp.]
MGALIEYFVRFIDMVSPRACHICGCRLAVTERAICARCNMHLPRTHFTRNPYDNNMSMLFWGRINVERCAALYFYHAQSETSRVILALKYLNHPEIGRLLGRTIAEEGVNDGFFNSIDMIIPVPLSPKREKSRGYNQSAEIAKGISDITGLPIMDKIITRTSFKQSQTHMHRWQRNENVENSFVLTSDICLDGKHILIVDDIVTTGATITACAGELQKHWKVKISVMSLGFTQN